VLYSRSSMASAALRIETSTKAIHRGWFGERHKEKNAFETHLHLQAYINYKLLLIFSVWTTMGESTHFSYLAEELK
jgi:hypothetical protein